MRLNLILLFFDVYLFVGGVEGVAVLVIIG